MQRETDRAVMMMMMMKMNAGGGDETKREAGRSECGADE